MNTFGSDPEFLLTINGSCVSSIGKINGTLSDKLQINGHYFYSDNVLAECAIKPGKNKKEVIQNFKECLKIYKDLVEPYCLEAKASEIFPDSELNHEDARRVGCAKEFCAYEMKQQESPIDEILNGNLRSCGGHIHLGSPTLQGDGAEPILIVYMMDLFLGVPSLWLDKDESSPRRRKLYGKAGRYRPKPYGVEYRSLSNFWLNSPDLVGLVYDLCVFCIDFLEQGKAWDFWDFDIDRFLEGDNLSDAWRCNGYNVENLRKGINNSDKGLVKDHMNLIQKILPNDIKKNMNSLIENYSINELYKNWKIT
jgi:hypothetical protein